jgi:hypothetical protein
MQRNTPKKKARWERGKVHKYIYAKRASTVITQSANLVQKENGYRAPIDWAPLKRKKEKKRETEWERDCFMKLRQ